MPLGPIIDESESEIELQDWAIALRSDGTPCFLGIREGAERGCMSAEIIEFGSDAMIGIARGGQRYHLRGDRHDFLGTVLWALLRGRSGEPVPRFIGPEELDLVLNPAPSALRC